MRRLYIVIIVSFLTVACNWGQDDSKQDNCSIGIDLSKSRGEVTKALKTKIDSLVEYQKNKVKGKTKSKEWVCAIRMEEYKKLLQDFQELFPQQEMQSGFHYVEERLITALQKYGLDNYIEIATSWCKGQLVYLECTFSSPGNVSFHTKRVVQFNKKKMYKPAANGDMYTTTFAQLREQDVVPKTIYVVFCLESTSPANPNDISRLKSLHPHEKIFIEGEIAKFKNKPMKTDLGGGVMRPEVHCVYLKNWVIRSPEYIDNTLRN